MSPQRYTELFVYPEDKDIVAIEVGKAINSPDADFNRQVEYRIIYATGEIGWISVNFFLVKNEVGITVKTYGVNQDITERKKAEAEIRHSGERYRQIVETAQEGIWMIDENDVTTFVNRKMAEILEYSIEEMMGKENYYFMDEEWKKNASQDIEKKKNRESRKTTTLDIFQKAVEMYGLIYLLIRFLMNRENIKGPWP